LFFISIAKCRNVVKWYVVANLTYKAVQYYFF